MDTDNKSPKFWEAFRLLCQVTVAPKLSENMFIIGCIMSVYDQVTPEKLFPPVFKVRVDNFKGPIRCKFTPIISE